MNTTDYQITPGESLRRLRIAREFFADFRKNAGVSSEVDMTVYMVTGNCNTRGCIAGWLGTIREFRELGLVTTPSPHCGSVDLRVNRNLAGGEAAMLFLGLDDDHLFYSFNLHSPEDVVRELDKIIGQKEQEVTVGQA